MTIDVYFKNNLVTGVATNEQVLVGHCAGTRVWQRWRGSCFFSRYDFVSSSNASLETKHKIVFD